MSSNDDDEDVLPELAELNYPRWLVQRAWARDIEHGELPHGGSLLTLPQTWFDDLDVLYARYSVIFRRLLAEKKSGEHGDPGLNEPLPEDFDGMIDASEVDVDAWRRGR